MFQRCLAFAIVVSMTGMVAHAQMSMPAIAGELAPPAVNAGKASRDQLVMGLRISNDFDDNALSYTPQKRSNMLTLIEPHIGWSLSTSRSIWTFDYRPGFAVSHQLSMYDSSSHVLDTNLTLALTQHITLRIRESFLQSTNPFESLLGSSPLSGASSLDHPNSPFAAVVQTRSEQSGADLYYVLSPHTTMAVGGAFFLTRYELPGQNRPLQRTQSASGHAIYSHRLSRRHWIGTEYRVQDLTSEEPRMTALVNSWFYIDTTQIRHNMSLTFFAGPELLTKRDEVPPFFYQSLRIPNASWQWAGGISYSWTGTRTSLMAGFSRRISDGGGLQGVVRASSIEAESHRQITRQWKADLLMS